LDVRGLTRRYGDKPGVADVSFTVKKNEIVGLLGPNGAGKSTIMKMLAGCLLPSSGCIFMDGENVLENPGSARARVGFMPEVPPLYPDMTVSEYLRFAAGIKGVEGADIAARIAEVMEITAVSDIRGRVIRNLSKGYRQRVGLAQALVGMPELLILDEPTAGLDPQQIVQVRALLSEMARGHTIILSSHILSEIGMVCEKIIIISRGRVVAEDTTENLASGDGGKFFVTLRADGDRALACIRAIPEVTSAEPVPDVASRARDGVCRFRVEGRGEEARVALFRAMSREDMPILELTDARRTLEQVFLSVTAGVDG
jgi:ABC-2 type transport system ATP-binding protein